MLQVGAADERLLARYRDYLVQGAAQFAQVYYDFLFENPATAEVLYTHERNGGDIGDLIRGQLNHFLSLLGGKPKYHPHDIGQRHFRHEVQAVWVLGAYRLYLSHLQNLVTDSPHVVEADRAPLSALLVKLVFRDMGVMLQGFWDAELAQSEQARAEAQQHSQCMDELLSNVPQMLWSSDVAGKLLYTSPAMLQRMSADSGPGIPFLHELDETQRTQATLAWEKACGGLQQTFACRLQGPGGVARDYRVGLYPAFDDTRSVIRIDAVLELAHPEAGTLHALLPDEDSRVVTPALWHDRIGQALAAQRRDSNAQLAVLLLEVDEAHAERSRALAKLFRSRLRDVDTLAHLGHRQLGIVLPNVVDARCAAERVAGKLLRELQTVDGPRISIGAALCPLHGEDAAQLLSRAEIARHHANRSEESQFLLYQGGEETAQADLIPLSAELRKALDMGQFELHYQPKVDVHERRLRGVEALLRWQHPQRGLLSPAKFMAAAEQSGLMPELTDWVLLTALRQCAAWQQQGLARIPVSVNISASQFRHPGFVRRVGQALALAGGGAGCLEIEINEQTLMADPERGTQTLMDLAAMQVEVAVDDFGTGQSSVSGLKRMQVDTLKIDRSFTADLPGNEQDAAIVRSIIDLAHNLGCRAVAEGVENDATWAILDAYGCDEAQGFHIGAPMPQDRLASWLGSGDYRLPS